MLSGHPVGDLLLDGEAAVLAEAIDFLAVERIPILLVVLGCDFPGKVESVLRGGVGTFWMESLTWLSTSKRCLPALGRSILTRKSVWLISDIRWVFKYFFITGQEKSEVP